MNGSVCSSAKNKPGDGDIEDLAGKMRMLLDDPAQRSRLSSNAVAWAEEFNWDTAAEKTLEILATYAPERIEE